LFIDIKPEVSYSRITKRTHGTRELFESPDALERIRKKGLALASLYNWQIVDGLGKPDDVESIIRVLLGLHEVV
jgi:thymidylate kinase